MKHLFRLTFLLACLFGLGTAYGQGIEAGSWGGKVRAGPGTQYQQIGSLQNGDPVRLLEDTRIMMNGYPWYRLTFKGRRTGYQWGGILCSFGNPIGGVHQVCERDNRRSVSAPAPTRRSHILSCAMEGRVRSVRGDTPATIQFRAVGENDETQFKIYWLDYQGRRKFYKHIFAGDLHRQSTYMTHPWLVTAPYPGGGEDCVAIYLPQRNGRPIILR